MYEYSMGYKFGLVSRVELKRLDTLSERHEANVAIEDYNAIAC